MRAKSRRVVRPRQAHRAPIRVLYGRAELAGGFGLRAVAQIFRPHTYTRMVEFFGDLHRRGGRPSSEALVKAEWQRRRAAGKLEGIKQDVVARDLEDWLAKNHPNAPHLGWRRISALISKWKKE